MNSTLWNHLPFVLAVAESGSFSGAGRQLGVNHATVLRHIAAFEEHCNMRVFERSQKGYHLTPESRHILSTLRGVSEMIDKMERTVAAQNSAISGPLRISVPNDLNYVAMANYCQQLQQKYPRLKSEIISIAKFADLSKREADFAVRVCKNPDPELESEFICDVTFRAYASKQYLKSLGGIRDARNLEWLGPIDILPEPPFTNWIEAHIPARKIVFRADSFSSLISLCEKGFGAAILPCSMADNSSALVRINNIAPVFSNGLWVVTHPDLAKSPKIQIAMAFFIEALKNDQELVESCTV